MENRPTTPHEPFKVAASWAGVANTGLGQAALATIPDDQHPAALEAVGAGST